MAQSRDANDPGDLLRGLRKQERAEFDREEAEDTGGQEHASREDREGIPAERRAVERAAEGSARSTEEQSDADALRVPRGDAVTGGGGQATRGPPPKIGPEPGKK